ncbi:hypothetical protein N7462_005439 [Penicillium macrosclerotiorum]|uniref:uncharacterized protein n=1 Tax=Penicillium macrosclerotiorum TaxID=303699 RepID=UPI002548460A|nr:uncharacterized protein N7462_005439 [Penicillium macrosclerotiorum]KAJ5682274.1 hypothetical protein N7462_005439 [Penicillium macrosclerotiorum]
MATQQAFEMKHWHGGQDFRDPKPNELRAMTMIVTRIKMYYQTPQTKADLVKYARVMYSHLPADEKPKGPVDVKQWAIGQVRDFYTALWENYPMIVIDHVAGPNGAPGRTQREVGQPHNFGRAKLFFNSNVGPGC